MKIFYLNIIAYLSLDYLKVFLNVPDEVWLDIKDSANLQSCGFLIPSLISYWV